MRKTLKTKQKIIISSTDFPMGYFVGKCILFIKLSRILLLKYGFLRWLSGKESACQGRRPRFHPWVGKIPWNKKWQLTPIFLLENPMDRGAWQAIIHGLAKESYTT